MSVMFFLAFLTTVLGVGGLLFVLAGYAAGCDPLHFLKPKIYVLDVWGRVYTTRYETLVRDNGDIVKCGYLYADTKVAPLVFYDDGIVTGLNYVSKWSFNRVDLIEKR